VADPADQSAFHHAALAGAVALGSVVAYLVGVTAIFSLQAAGWIRPFTGYPLDDILTLSDPGVVVMYGAVLGPFLGLAVWRRSRAFAVVSSIVVPLLLMAVVWRSEAPWSHFSPIYGDSKEAALVVSCGVSCALALTLWVLRAPAKEAAP
jgi:hypothetical protein